MAAMMFYKKARLLAGLFYYAAAFNSNYRSIFEAYLGFGPAFVGAYCSTPLRYLASPFPMLSFRRRFSDPAPEGRESSFA
ncbi:hypothetical protein TRIP_C20607 [Candidatus Zixiibacteriota bacterium]|nr:hypothetical protein TRIP_C20607 [candidate division Zixibacteria bacterium]